MSEKPFEPKAPKPLEPEDPYEGVTWVVPHVTSPEACLAMARTFIEEYLRIGWTEEAILELFRDPLYRGPYGLLQAFGEETILGLIQKARRGQTPSARLCELAQVRGLTPKRRAFCG